MWLITITTIIFAVYIILLRIFRMGWKGMDYFETKKSHLLEAPAFKTSVVVCCRNEEKNLPALLAALANQTYQDFELILVNDHSTDRTKEIMLNAQQNFSDFKYIEAENSGKKAGLVEAILQAKGELIITTDGDCIPEKTWIETIVRFEIENPSHLIICPVKLKDKKTFFSRLQIVEFTSLVAVGSGTAGAQMPILCNAANLAFTKTAWLKSKDDLKPDEISGDDIFLLQSIKKRGGVIHFLKSKKAFVTTEGAKNIREFFRQRKRWAGKSTAYTDKTLILTACTIFGLCLCLILLLVLGIWYKILLYFFALFFILKFFYDYRFLSQFNDFFPLPFLPLYSVCLSIVYPLYIVFTAISALFFKPKKW